MFLALRCSLLSPLPPAPTPYPCPNATILQALITLSSDLHILLPLCTFGVPSTKTDPLTFSVFHHIPGQPKELAEEAATCRGWLTDFLEHCCQLVAIV